jgi:hypothetical protein
VRTAEGREHKETRKGLRTDSSDASFISGGLLNTHEKREKTSELTTCSLP